MSEWGRDGVRKGGKEGGSYERSSKREWLSWRMSESHWMSELRPEFYGHKDDSMWIFILIFTYRIQYITDNDTIIIGIK